MSNKSIENKISIRYKIFSDCSEKTINFLKENNVKFQVWKLHELIEEDYELLEETVNVSIPEELYNELDKLCKINNLDPDKKIIELLGASVFSAEISDENGSKHVDNF